MKTSITFFLFFVLLSTTSFSQQKFEYRNNIQGELGGHGLFYSINYERLLLNQSKFKLTARAGLAYYPPSSGMDELWLPFSFNGLISFEKHHLEIGTGQVIRKETLKKNENIATLGDPDFIQTFTLGYRYQRPESRHFFRVAFTPFVEVFLNEDGRGQDSGQLDTAFHPLGGVAFGYAF